MRCLVQILLGEHWFIPTGLLGIPLTNVRKHPLGFLKFSLKKDQGVSSTNFINVVRHLAISMTLTPNSNPPRLGTLVYVDGFTRHAIHEYEKIEFEFPQEINS